AQAPEQSKDETPVELPADEPLDLSTPEPDADTLKAPTPFAVKPSAPDWNGKAGIDYSKPSIPAVTFQPDQLLAGTVPDQSSGVAWATITAPGFEAPLGWDKTSIDTRVDPSHEQGKLGTTLSRSVPLGDDVSLTLQNGVSMTRALPNATGQAHSWATSQALRFNILPTDTTVSLGADISSIDDKWLRTLSAEQKLFGGPFSVTGSGSETPTGEVSKNLQAGFKPSRGLARHHVLASSPRKRGPIFQRRWLWVPACAGTTTFEQNLLRRAAAFAHRCAGVPEHADHDPARAHQQHATVRHGVAIILGLRHAGGDLVGHRAQLDRRRQLGPDIGVDGSGRLTLQRLVDRAALIVRERLEGVGNGDERVVGRVLGGELRRHRIGIGRRVRNCQGTVDECRVRRRGGI